MTGFSERLKEERKRLGLSQADMAEAGGVSLNSQSNYENGHRSPDAVFLERIASLGVDVTFLLLGTRTPAQMLARVERPVARELFPRRVGWQSVDGPVIGWIASRLTEIPAVKQLVHRAQGLGVQWVIASEKEIRAAGEDAQADFALQVDPSPSSPDGSPIERAKRAFERFHRAAYGISLLDFEAALVDLEERGHTIREALWRKVFGETGPLEPGAVFLLSTSRDPGAQPVKHLLRVSYVVGGNESTDLWLIGHWEATGEVAQVAVARIDGSIVHVGSSEAFVPSDLAKRFRTHELNQGTPSVASTPAATTLDSTLPASAETVMRPVTREEAALLDNYEAADEKGRAAARSVLDALAQPQQKRA